MLSKHPFVCVAQIACVREYDMVKEDDVKDLQVFLNERETFLTIREVCERLFIRLRTLKNYQDKGIIPYNQITGKLLYRLSDLQRLLQENYRR